MAWSSLGASGGWVITQLKAVGGPAYKATMAGATASLDKLAAANIAAGNAAAYQTKKSFLQNQVTFTGRRLLFYSTLGVLAAAAAVVKLGFSYTNTMQQAQVAIQPIIKDQTRLNKVLNDLFLMAAETPFHMQEIVQSFRAIFAPFTYAGFTVREMNATLKATMDALAQSGKLTTGQLNRVTTQMIHMINLGRPTGQVLTALARDGLPVYAALRKELHLTDAEMKNISTSGLTAKDVIMAINKYIETTPGYKGQAFLTQTKTLAGAWNTFIDFLSQSSSGAVKGPFSRLQHGLQAIDKQLGDTFAAKKNVSMTDMVKIIDNHLTPSTHLLLNAFIVTTTALKTMRSEFQLLLAPVMYVADAFAGIVSIFGGSGSGAVWLGRLLGTGLVLKGLFQVRTLLVAIKKDFLLLMINPFKKAFTWLLITLPKLIKLWKTYALTKGTADATYSFRRGGGTGPGSVITGGFLNKGFWAKVSRFILSPRASIAMLGTSILGNIRRWRDWATKMDQVRGPLGRMGQHFRVNDGILAKSSRVVIGFGDTITKMVKASIKRILLLRAAFAGVGVEASASGTKVTKLGMVLRALPIVTAITLALTLLIERKAVDKAVSSWLRKHHLGFFTGPVFDYKSLSKIPFSSIPSGTERDLMVQALHNANLTKNQVAQLRKMGYPGFAKGGAAVKPGWGVVGEQGPELTYMPRGASVIPLKHNPLKNYKIETSLLQPIVLNLDGRKVAETVAKWRVVADARI